MTIVLIGYYGFANAGDEAILASIAHQFRSRVPGVRLVAASGDPAATVRAHRMEAVAWNRLAELERAISGADLVVIGGGGLFHDYWGADPDTLLTDRHWGIAYYASCAFLAALHGKPLFFYSVGMGPLVSAYGVRLTRAACEAAALISVRDAASRDILVGIGVPVDKIHVTADPAFAFRPARSTTLAVSLPTEARLTAPVLGVALRNWDFGVSPEFLERELAAALDSYLETSGGTVVFFAFQQLEGAQDGDRAVARRVQGRMRHSARAWLSTADSPERIYDSFRDCQVILGMRLHALIFAATLRIPAVALSYDPKIDALGHERRFDVRSIDARSLSRSLIEAAAPGALAAPEPVPPAREAAALALELLEAPAPQPRLGPDALDLLRRGLSAQIASAEAARQRDATQEQRILAFAGENETLRGALAAAENKVQEAAKLQRDTQLAVRLFRANSAAAWNVLRPQKAWRIMLLIRKAYTLLVRGSKVRFLGWAVRAAVGRAGDLDEFQPSFPEIEAYLPETYRAPAAETGETVPDPHPQKDRYDVVVLAIIDFDFRFQRPQQLAAEMARRGHRVFFVSPSRFLAPQASAPFEILPLRENLWEVRLRCPSADIYMGELRPDHVAAMTASLETLRDAWNLGDSILLVQLPFWRRLALAVRESFGARLVYDCMDDWETFQNMGSFNVSEEKGLVLECDVLVVTGAELENKYRAQGLSPVLVRNGADFAFFSQAKPRLPLPGVTAPIVGYFGAIADWIDLDLVLAVAQLRPQYAFVLIGQVFDRDTSALAALPNVHLLGNQKYEDIPSFLLQFDACLIPFLLNQVTKATDPVKLYEYFSQGKPVVATDMAELRQCADLLYIGREPEHFAAQIDRALSETGHALGDARIAFAAANTWAVRVDQIDAAAAALFPLVSILIVTYNSEEFVAPCLDSLFQNTAYPRYEVIAVDNASTDATLSRLRAYERLRLIPLTENTGFAAANNRAAAEARGQYLVFLNADTMTPPGWLHTLVEHVRRDDSIGQICPVTNFAGNEAKINVTYKDAREMEAFARARARSHRGRVLDVGVAPLFCALVPRAVWDRVGPLDTQFGMGMFEDDDFSMRVRAAGWRVAVAEDCFVHHFGQGSFAKLSSETYNRAFEKNRALMEQKWKTPWAPHRTRPGVRPAFEERRFQPEVFVSAGDAR